MIQFWVLRITGNNFFIINCFIKPRIKPRFFFDWMKYLFLISLSVISLTGCKLSDTTPVDAAVSPAVIGSVQLQSATFNTDTILVNGALSPDDDLTISTTAYATVKVISDIQAVSVVIMNNTGDTQYGSGTLYDNGEKPDSVPHDSIFSGTVSFSILYLSPIRALSFRAATVALSCRKRWVSVSVYAEGSMLISMTVHASGAR